MSRGARAPLATPEAMALEPAAFPTMTKGEPTEAGFADWRDRLRRNLARRSDGRWEPLTRASSAQSAAPSDSE